MVKHLQKKLLLLVAMLLGAGTGAWADEEEQFVLFTGNLVEGDYVIYYDGKALNNVVSSGRLQYAEIEPEGYVIITDNAAIVWHIAINDEGYWTIYNADANAYAASTGVKNRAQMLEDPTDDMSLWAVSGSWTYEFVNKANAAGEVNANLRNNGIYGFACYPTTIGGGLSLYKRADDNTVFSVTVTEAGWATYLTHADVSIPEGLEAYIVTGADLTKGVELQKVENVAAFTPILLKGSAKTYGFEGTDMWIDNTSGNLLRVYDEEQIPDDAPYLWVLAKDDNDKACFMQWVGESREPLTNCVVMWLPFAADNSQEGNETRTLSLDEDGTQGISNVQQSTFLRPFGSKRPKVERNVQRYTDLEGRGVTQPNKGLYVVNGKKVIIK